MKVDFNQKELLLIYSLMGKALLNFLLTKPHENPKTSQELKAGLLLHPLSEKEAYKLYYKLRNYREAESED